MQNNRMVLEVAKWEFNRWFKLKEQIITILVGVLLSALIFGSIKLFSLSSGTAKKIAVLSNTPTTLINPDSSRITFSYLHSAKIDSAMQLLHKSQIDGVLHLSSLDSATLHVAKQGAWTATIHEALNVSRRVSQMQKAKLTDAQMQQLFANSQLNIRPLEAAGPQASAAEKIAAGIFIGIMLIMVFIGLSYQFVAITGEKQLRITEVIVSAVSPQVWIDGKIIGISLLSLALLTTYVISSLLFVVVSSVFGSGWELPVGVVRPERLLLLLAFALLGFAFWNTFFASIAATISDPNTSARGSLIMLPTIPIALAFSALGDAGTLFMRILSLFPITAAPIMSVRLVLGEVPWYDIIISLALLLLSVHFMRNMAGRIFALSILMHGKEPSWSEMARWIKQK